MIDDCLSVELTQCGRERLTSFEVWKSHKVAGRNTFLRLEPDCSGFLSWLAEKRRADRVRTLPALPKTSDVEGDLLARLPSTAAPQTRRGCRTVPTKGKTRTPPPRLRLHHDRSCTRLQADCASDHFRPCRWTGAIRPVCWKPGSNADVSETAANGPRRALDSFQRVTRFRPLGTSNQDLIGRT